MISYHQVISVIRTRGRRFGTCQPVIIYLPSPLRLQKIVLLFQMLECFSSNPAIYLVPNTLSKRRHAEMTKQLVYLIKYSNVTSVNEINIFPRQFTKIYFRLFVTSMLLPPHRRLLWGSEIMDTIKAILVFNTRGGLCSIYFIWFKYTSTNMSAVSNSFSLI